MSEVTLEQIEARIAANEAAIARMKRDGTQNHLEQELYDGWIVDNAIYTLALVGLSVQPRPIEEAPKDGIGILAIYDKFESLDRFDLRRWQRREWAKKLPIGWADKYGQLRLVQPTHFIPLSALPTPKDVT